MGGDFLTMDQKLINEIREMPREIENLPNITKKIIDDLKSKEFPIPIVKIVGDLNFFVGKQQMEDNLSGYIVISDEVKERFGKRKLICVNTKDSIGHQRFTIAHELAHYLFDYDENENCEFYNTYKTDEVQSDEEIRANKFAANLLMPEEEFKRQYNIFIHSESFYQNMTEYFQVSKKAVARRIDELGLNNGD